MEKSSTGGTALRALTNSTTKEPIDVFACRVLDMECRYPHEDCNDTGEHLYVKFKGSGWVYYCHRCGKRGFLPSTVQDRLITLFNKKDHPEIIPSDEVFELPLAFSRVLPYPIRAYLNTYDIWEEEWSIYDFRHDYVTDRLVLPCYRNEYLQGYQSRKMKDRPGPKYLTIKGPGIKTLFFTSSRDSDEIVLVEDILSAIKVGRVRKGLAVLGSPKAIPQEITREITNKKHVYIWLDPDKLRTALGWQKSLNNLGISSSVISTDKDPKEFGTIQIGEKLKRS